MGLGVTLGIAVPYIENSGSGTASGSESSDDAFSIPVPGLPGGIPNPVELIASETKFSGRMLGVSLLASKSLSKSASVYGSFTYAKQFVRVKNDTFRFETDVDGAYVAYDLGMRYQPLSTKKDFGFITLNPALYMNFGLNFSMLVLDDFEIDLSGNNYQLENSKMKGTTKTMYMGFGYTF